MQIDQLKRREFITLLGGAAVCPLAARAQQPDRMRLISVLEGYAESDSAAQSNVAAFRRTLAKLGWTEGSNLRIELRWSAGNADRTRTFAKELVDLRADAILCDTTPGIAALARETRTIPIVFTAVADPVASGFVQSLAHPGGNLTGFTTQAPAIGGKWVGLLKEIAPRTVRVAMLFNPATAPTPQLYIHLIESVATSLAIQTSAASVHAKDEIEGVIAALARDPGGGLIVMPDVFNVINRDLVIALAARYGVPAIYFTATYFAKSGGLICYGTDFAEQFRQAAGYVDRFLKGEKPADLPIQLPSKFELVINLKTAKTLGLTIPQTLLATADEVIE
jgi:putative tryptophan/tyrosine transport system substrate-binding protein